MALFQLGLDNRQLGIFLMIGAVGIAQIGFTDYAALDTVINPPEDSKEVSLANLRILIAAHVLEVFILIIGVFIFLKLRYLIRILEGNRDVGNR